MEDHSNKLRPTKKHLKEDFTEKIHTDIVFEVRAEMWVVMVDNLKAFADGVGMLRPEDELYSSVEVFVVEGGW
jgi:hypothetical protein